MPNVGPPAVVDGPAVEALRYGLFSVSLMPEVTNSRWQNGTIWESQVPCDPADAYGVECSPPEPAGIPLVPREGQDQVESLPFGVTGSYQCKSLSRPLEEARARAVAHLLGWEERQVERAIMHGALGNAPSFQGAVDLSGGVAVDGAHALNLLEEFLGQNVPGIGVLHIPRALTGAFTEFSAFTRQGTHLETLVGTLVAMGAGYDTSNIGPDGAAAPAGARWVYATARPVIRRGEVFTTGNESSNGNALIDTENNDVTVFAHRTYVVGWDCTVGAVLVDQTAASGGGGGFDGGSP